MWPHLCVKGTPLSKEDIQVANSYTKGAKNITNLWGHANLNHTVKHHFVPVRLALIKDKG